MALSFAAVGRNDQQPQQQQQLQNVKTNVTILKVFEPLTRLDSNGGL